MISKKKEVIPCIFYFYLHSKLRELTKDSIMAIKEVEWNMFQWRIPKKIRPLIIKEMEILELVKKEGRRCIRLLKSDFDMEDLNKFYTELGIYK